jgi:hypothetical protein
MMAMFGWTDPKMPAHYIAQLNWEKLGISDMTGSWRSIRPERAPTFCRHPIRTKS